MRLTLIWRQCHLSDCTGPHQWERLNPMTYEPFRRGRVLYVCYGMH